MNLELILVDDDKVVLVVLEKMIHKVNAAINLTFISSGKETLAHLNSISGQVNSRFLMIDINLKDMSCWDILNELEARNDKCSKVILMTSSVSTSNTEIAKKYPSVIGFFEKPILFENIHQIFELIKKE
jgi:DNA-binding NtrC family response regulator